MNKKQNKQRFQRVLSVLAVLFVFLGTLLVVQAGSGAKTRETPGVTHMSLDSENDAKYQFELEATENSTVEIWGYEGRVLAGKDQFGIDNWIIMPTDDSLSGNIGCWYRNVGIYDQKPVDVKCTYYWNAGAETTDTHQRLYPVICASIANQGAYATKGYLAFQFATTSYEVKYELYCEGQLIDPVNLSIMFKDIDNLQAFGFQNNGNGTIHDIQCQSDATNYYTQVGNYHVFYAGKDTPESDDGGESGVRMELDNTNSFNIVYAPYGDYFYGATDGYPLVDQLDPDLLIGDATYIPRSTANQFWMDLMNDPASTMEDLAGARIPDQNGTPVDYNMGWGYFTGDAFGSYIDPSLSLTKEAAAYEWEVGDTVTYTVQVNQTVPGTHANRITVSDTLPAGLSLIDAQVSGVNGITMTKTGEVWEAKIPELDHTQTATFTVIARALEAGNGKELVNTARAVADNAGEVTDSAEIYVNSPSLALTKSVSKYEWQVGDTVDYTVKVRNTKAGTIARDVVISDTSLPAGLTLAGDPKLTGAPGSVQVPIAGDKAVHGETKEAAVTNSIARKGTGWEASLSHLASGAEVTITYPCKATEAGNGKELVNTARAVASNAGEVTDTAEVYVNSPSLALTKSVSKYEWQIGDTVDYQVTVKNTKAGTIARELVITDTSLPAGLTLTGAPRLAGVPATIRNPVAGDKTVHNETQGKTVTSSISRKGSGFEIKVSDLPADTLLTITYPCTATEAGNGKELVNTAKAGAANAREVSDTAEVYLNSPSLTVTKSVAGYEWQVGDTVDYTVKVRNTKAGTLAKDVVISDISLPEGLTLTGDPQMTGAPEKVQVPIAGDKAVHKETQEKTVTSSLDKKGTGWEAKLSYLPDGREITITYQCKATEAGNGKELVNTAKAAASNAPEVEDSAEIYVNTANLQIAKEVSEYEWQVGDTVDYTVRVRNTKVGTIARELVITDATFPAGLELMEAPTLTGAPGTIENPIAGEKTVHNETQEKTVISSTTKKGTGFETRVSDLPEGNEVILTFQCKVKEEINGMEVINTAHAIASNAEDTKDSAKIWVNTPDLKLDKDADIKQVRVGDIITYTLTLTNQKRGTLARNIRVTDAVDEEDNPYVKLQKNSIVLLDTQGRPITDAAVTVKDNTFEIQTKEHLVCPDNNYQIWDMENQKEPREAEALNPQGVNEEGVFTLEYQVKITSQDAAGEDIRNTAVAGSDEIPEVPAEEEVVVNGPHLDIEKVSDKQAYGQDEEALYKVTVRQTREGYEAKDVVITDSFAREGVTIKEDSIQIKYNGNPINPKSVTLSEGKNGYTIETGVTLKDTDKLTVTYKAVFEEAAIEDTDMVYVNLAKAKGSNTKESQTDHRVIVTQKEALLQVKKEADKAACYTEDSVRYTIKADQLIDGAVARQVVLTDVFDKEGMTIREETLKLSINGKGFQPKSVTLSEGKNGYTIETGRDLSARDSLLLTYEVQFSEDAGNQTGQTHTNTVTARGENTNETSADYTVTVTSVDPVVEVMKEAERETYAVGDTAHYTIKVTQTAEGAIAKQVILTDAFAQGGMEIQADTFEMQVNGKAAEPKSVALNKEKNGFTIETGADLTETDELTLTYDVIFTQEVEGGKATNTATARGEDGEEGKDDSTVTVSTPSLTLVKEADKEKAQPGDTVSYKLTLTAQGGRAKQVVIKDALSHSGASLKEDTLQVYDQEKTPITKALSSIKATDRGFTLETGRDLAEGESLTVTYDVELKEGKPGEEVKNTASSTGENTEEVTDSSIVRIPDTYTPQSPDEPESFTAPKTGIRSYALPLLLGGGLLLFVGIRLFRRSRKGTPKL